MKTIEEQIKVMQHFVNGGEIECWDYDQWTIVGRPKWNWEYCDYRVKEKQKEQIKVFEVYYKDGTGNFALSPYLFEDEVLEKDKTLIKTGRSFMVDKDYNV